MSFLGIWFERLLNVQRAQTGVRILQGALAILDPDDALWISTYRVQITI